MLKILEEGEIRVKRYVHSQLSGLLSQEKVLFLLMCQGNDSSFRRNAGYPVYIPQLPPF